MVLIVIDMQRGLDSPQYGDRNNLECEHNIHILLQTWRAAARPVVFTRHFSERPGSPLAEDDPESEIKEAVQPLPNEPVFTKRTNSAFKNQQFCTALDSFGDRNLLFVGMATDACVTATGREAKDLGYKVFIAADACATFDRRSPSGAVLAADLVHEVSLAALAASGLEVGHAADFLELSGMKQEIG